MRLAKEFQAESLGDGALRITLPDPVDARAVLQALRTLPCVLDVVVTERYACVYFDPATPPDDPAAALARIMRVSPAVIARPPVIIRARYDGPDLARVAEYAGLTSNEVIEIHAARAYTVLVIGFMPGFAYLGEVDPRIAAPRLPSPRTRVPAGAVGIAGPRTGIYPFNSPGGWNLIASAIGFTGFHPTAGAALQLGDRVRFEPV